MTQLTRADQYGQMYKYWEQHERGAKVSEKSEKDWQKHLDATAEKVRDKKAEVKKQEREEQAKCGVTKLSGNALDKAWTDHLKTI